MIKRVFRCFTNTYRDTYTRSLQDPLQFWAEQANNLSWDKPFTHILDDSNSPHMKWFPDGKLNLCYNCLDLNVQKGFGDTWALIYDSPLTNKIIHFTYHELLDEVQKLAGVFTYRHNIQPGDRVVIYMPLIPEAIVAMLACARIGAIHSVVFGGFAAKELGNRILDSEPKLIVTTNVGLEPNRKIKYIPIVDEAQKYAADNGLQKAEEIPRIILNRGLDVDYDFNPKRDFDFYEEVRSTKMMKSYISVSSTHPSYVLYTSGTTGAPKGIVRDTGGYATVLKASMKWLFDINRGDVFWSSSDIGWVVGHSFIVYGPLLAGSTSIIFEGKPVGTPDAGAWWRVMAQHRVKAFFGAPTGIRAIKKEDPQGLLLDQQKLSHLQQVALAGERCDPDTIKWLQRILPQTTLINDHWWQTESGWPMISNYKGFDDSPFPTKPGSATLPVPGYDVRFLNEQGQQVEKGETGNIVIKLPTPPGFMKGLWRNEAGFVEKYFSKYPGYYNAGDEGVFDEDGYITIMGRTDDVINTAGHRLSTNQIEEVIGYHDLVAECCCIGVKDDLKGEVPVALIVLKSHGIQGRNVEHEIIQKVREDIGPVAAMKSCIIVERLPKTRSGKIVRATLRKIADGEEYVIPSTIEDASVLDEVKTEMELYGLGRK